MPGSPDRAELPMDPSLIVLDTETATLRGAPHLVELAAVRVAAGEAGDHFRSLVRPQVPIEPGATEVHGLVDDDVRDAPEAAEALERFRDWVGDAWMIAHNARADAHVLGFEFARTRLEPPPGALLDSLALAKQALPEAPDHKLATLAAHLGIEVGASHRALDDAVACWQVVEACVERLGGWDEVTPARLLDRCGIPVRIATAGPKLPRRQQNRVLALDRATRRGEEVTLHYRREGGAHDAPARLPVVPRLVYEMNDHGYLEGECVQSGTLKTYRIDRMQKIETP